MNGFGGGAKSRDMTGGFVNSETDFLRLLKKEEGFLAKEGGAGGCVSFGREALVCGTLGKDFSWLAMCALLLGVVRGRLLEYMESISAGRG